MVVTATPTTKDVIARMLKENTGRHFLDSGGHYGRHWEQNQFREFESEPATTLTFRWGLELTHNLYHWLEDRVDYDDQLQNIYLEWVENNSDRYTSDFVDVQEFVEWLKDQPFGYDYGSECDDTDCCNPYAIEGDGDVMTVNTYNGEDLLSQTIQYTRWVAADREEYALIQIHNGCDVRGGYTSPKAFRVMEEYALFDNARGGIFCDEHNWSTDDGYHYYYDGSTGYTQLQEYDRVEIDLEAEVVFWGSDEWIYPTLEYSEVVEVYEFMGWDHSDILPVEPQRGKLSVDQEGNGYCPRCGGLLKGGFY